MNWFTLGFIVQAIIRQRASRALKLGTIRHRVPAAFQTLIYNDFRTFFLLAVRTATWFSTSDIRIGLKISWILLSRHRDSWRYGIIVSPPDRDFLAL